MREEIDGHRIKILEISGFSQAELQAIQHRVYEPITFFTEAMIPFEFWKKAADYVRDVDMDDIAFVALSLFLDIKLWTGDKKLREGLIHKGFNKCISTSEMLILREK